MLGGLLMDLDILELKLYVLFLEKGKLETNVQF